MLTLEHPHFVFVDFEVSVGYCLEVIVVSHAAYVGCVCWEVVQVVRKEPDLGFDDEHDVILLVGLLFF